VPDSADLSSAGIGAAEVGDFRSCEKPEQFIGSCAAGRTAGLSKGFGSQEIREHLYCLRRVLEFFVLLFVEANALCRSYVTLFAV
jgi:hypothetical protein